MIIQSNAYCAELTALEAIFETDVQPENMDKVEYDFREAG